jgi:hypothetical protein
MVARPVPVAQQLIESHATPSNLTVIILLKNVVVCNGRNRFRAAYRQLQGGHFNTVTDKSWPGGDRCRRTAGHYATTVLVRKYMLRE